MRPIAWMMAAAAAALLTGPPRTTADDDLAVVKKAVASAQAPPAEGSAAKAAPTPRKSGKAEPQWLRVRAFKKDAKGETRKRVFVNVPLSLVRALDDFPIDLCGHHRWHDSKEPGRRCELKLADVLATLDAGQELVEVEGEDETVKIWVE